MKTKHVTAVILSMTLLVTVSLTAQDNGSISARQVVERVKQNVTCPWSQKTNDTFKAGDPDPNYPLSIINCPL